MVSNSTSLADFIILQTTGSIEGAIVVVIDESPCSEAALEALMARTWKPDMEVLVLTVIEPMTSKFTPSAAEKVAKNSECSGEIVRHKASEKQQVIEKRWYFAEP
jgi:hypothetical protein